MSDFDNELSACEQCIRCRYISVPGCTSQEERERFVESWGSPGILWGINRSMARIHALLLVSEEPIDADTIPANLNISRGITSMCLKELRSRGAINRVHVSGERRRLFEIEEFTTSLDHVIKKFLESKKCSRTRLELLKPMTPK